MGDGRFAAMPLMRGGESDWVARMIGTPNQPRGVNALLGAPFMAYIAVGDPKYDFMTFDPERDFRVLDGGIAAAEVHQQNPNIAPFVRERRQAAAVARLQRSGPEPAVDDRLLRGRARRSADRARQRAAVSGTGRAALRRRPRARSVRRADGTRELGRARRRTDDADRDETRLAAVAAALSVSRSCRATRAPATRTTPRASNARSNSF